MNLIMHPTHFYCRILFFVHINGSIIIQIIDWRISANKSDVAEHPTLLFTVAIYFNRLSTKSIHRVLHSHFKHVFNEQNENAWAKNSMNANMFVVYCYRLRMISIDQLVFNLSEPFLSRYGTHTIFDYWKRVGYGSQFSLYVKESIKKIQWDLISRYLWIDIHLICGLPKDTIFHIPSNHIWNDWIKGFFLTIYTGFPYLRLFRTWKTLQYSDKQQYINIYLLFE